MGLIKSALQAAVFVKTAHVVHDRIERRQQAEWAAQGHPAPGGPPGSHPDPSYATPASPSATAPDDTSARLAQLVQLGELRAAGVLTDAEFEAQKARILNG